MYTNFYDLNSNNMITAARSHVFFPSTQLHNCELFPTGNTLTAAQRFL